MRVYVIASYDHAPLVRAIHDRLREIGIEPTSSWAETAHGPEELERLSDVQCWHIWNRNGVDMNAADIVLVLADTPMREGWAEVERARRNSMHIVWVGRPTLGARADGWRTWFVAGVDDALAALRQAVTESCDNRR